MLDLRYFVWGKRQNQLYLPILGDLDLFVDINCGLFEYSVHVDDEFKHHAGVIIALTAFDVELPQKALLQLITVYRRYLKTEGRSIYTILTIIYLF